MITGQEVTEASSLYHNIHRDAASELMRLTEAGTLTLEDAQRIGKRLVTEWHKCRDLKRAFLAQSRQPGR